MSAIQPLSGDKRTSGEWAKNDASDPESTLPRSGILRLNRHDVFGLRERQLKRREFIRLLGGATATWPIAARAQATDRVRTIGVLATFAEDNPNLVAFRNRLQELGWTEAKLRIATRVAEDGQRMRTAAAELATLAPEAILSTTSTTARSLLDATSTIPIVSAVLGDPIALGFTRSLSRPTGNITGFTTFNDTVASKRLEMLREMMGSMNKAALIWVPVNPQQVLLAQQTEQAAKDLGIELVSLPLNSADDIAPALVKADNAQVQAIVVAADPLTLANARAIIDGCAARGLPSMHTFIFETRSGALMSYGVDLLENYRSAADYIDQILRGAKVSDLPFQEPTRLTLSINLGTARSLRIVVPNSLLTRADEVIE
jgi:putative ABC transport system substrate-binding protein